MVELRGTVRIFDDRGLHVGDGHAELGPATDVDTYAEGVITAPLWTLSLTNEVSLEFPCGTRVDVRILDLVSLDGYDARANLAAGPRSGPGGRPDGPRPTSATR